MFRKVAFLTCQVGPHSKVKINLSGCNFDCRYCFAIAKKKIGRTLSVDGLLNLFVESCSSVYGDLVDDVQLTGGEPTEDPDYLLSLIRGLRNLGVSKIGISTNGYTLDRDLVGELKSLSVNYVKLDLKACTDELHEWYTGKSNANVLKAVRLLHEHGMNFYVRTIFVPNIVDVSEIEKIAKFLRSVDEGILYRLYEFAPEQLDNELSRKPTEKEMLNAYNVAKKYLDNVELFLYKASRPSAYEIAYEPYEPDHKIFEVRADELLESFEKVDEVAKSADRNWNVQYFTMNQVLSTPKKD